MAPANTLLAIRQVQLLPQYESAELLCSKQHFKSASTLLAKLSTSPAFTCYQIAFIQQQRELCIAHLLHATRVTDPPALPLIPPKPDCGPHALSLVLQYLGMPDKLADIEQHTPLTSKGCSMEELARDAKRYGLHPTGVQVARNGMNRLKTPAIGWVDNNHYIAVYTLRNGLAVVHDPNGASATTISQEELLRLTGGYFLEISR